MWITRQQKRHVGVGVPLVLVYGTIDYFVQLCFSDFACSTLYMIG